MPSNRLPSGMRRSANLNAFTSCLLIAGTATTGGAVAQEPASTAVLDEITVTAQRRDQSLQDVPISVSVMSGEGMERSNLLNLEDISSRMPAVKLAQAPGSDLLNIRGIGSGLNPGFEQSVATFVDGVYRGRSRSIRAALFDVERVEVLKGPQITYFGNNAIAGAFNITTRKPTQEFTYNVNALYEPDHGEYVLEGAVGGPLSDTLAARAAVRFSGMDGYIENTWTGEDGPDRRDTVGRVSLDWQPTDDFRSELRVDGYRARNRGTFNTELVNCPPSEEFQPMLANNVCNRYLQASGGDVDDELDYRSGADSTYSDVDMLEAAWTNTWYLENHTLVATTGHYDHETSQLVSLMPVPITGIAGSSTLLSNAGLEEFDQLSQEIRLQSEGGQFIDYMVGAYYSESELWSRGYTGFYFMPFGAFPPATAVGYTGADPLGGWLQLDQEDSTYSVFGSATVNMSDALRLNLGLRYTAVEKSAERSSWHGLMPGPRPSDFVPASSDAERLGISGALGGNLSDFPVNSREDDDLLPSVGLEWDLSQDLMTYISYSDGFKAGGFTRASTPDVIGPETVDAWELGLKGSAREGSVNFGVALFHSAYEGLQENVSVYEPDGRVTGRIRNVGEAVSKGVELNAMWQMSQNLQFTGDIAYLDAQYTDFPNGPCTALQAAAVANCVQDLTDSRKAYAPRWSGSVGFRFFHPMENLEWTFEPNLRFSSEYFQVANADPLLEQSGYGKLDARLALGALDGDWSIALIGKNLTDRTTASFRNAVGTAPGSIYAMSERPRSIAIQFTARH